MSSHIQKEAQFSSQKGLNAKEEESNFQFQIHKKSLTPIKQSSQEQFEQMIDDNLIEQSNHKPTLISQGLFPFNEDERINNNNQEFFNLNFNYDEGVDNFVQLGQQQEEDQEQDDYLEEEQDSINNYQLNENNQTNFNNNLNSENKQFLCEYEECGKSFKAKKSLRDHLRIHTNQRPYSCAEPYCGKAFVQHSSLQKHTRIHKGDRPYKCDYSDCDQAFTQVSNLIRHQKIHLNDKPFECSECFKRFTTSSNLKQHLITHGSQGMRQRYKCAIDDCGKSYSYQSSLKKHEKDHILVSQINPAAPPSGLIKIVNELCDVHGNNKTKAEQVQLYFPSNHLTEVENKAIPNIEEDDDVSKQQEKSGDASSSSQNMNFSQKIQQENVILPKSSQQNPQTNPTSSKGEKNSRVNLEDMSILGQFFNSHQIALQHDGHYDVLFKGYLYHYNRRSGKIEIHEIQANDEISKGTCQPLSELSHNQNEKILKKNNESENRIGEHQTGSQISEPHLVSNPTCNKICEPTANNISIFNQSEECCKESQCNKQIISINQVNQNENQQLQQFEQGEVNQQQSNQAAQNIIINKEFSKCCNISQFHSNQISNEFIQNQEKNDIKYEDCCCTVDSIKQECTCNGCEGDCPTCSKSLRCIFKRGELQEMQDSSLNVPPISQYQIINNNNSVHAEKDSIKEISFSQSQFLEHDNSKCICNDSKDIKHFHGPNCGHIPIYHHGHLDYIVENSLHYPHGSHCDFHGTIQLLDNIQKI